MSSTDFDDHYWHDAVILDITIDRRDPGNVDQVVMTIEWPDETRSSFCFLECRGLSMEMNFGVIAPESIRTASESSDSERLCAVRAKWLALGVSLDALRAYEFETNSTASKILILAEGWTETSIGGTP